MTLPYSPPLRIALDGPSGVGKGTLGQKLATTYDITYIDTGRMYRVLARESLRRSIPADDVTALCQVLATLDQRALADDSGLRDEATGQRASQIAVHAAVRDHMVQTQRALANTAAEASGGVVLDGRDIGTVVLPDAPVKLYLTARDTVRAERRRAQLGVEAPDFATVLADLQERDRRDTDRAAGAMHPADDAVVLDTSDMDAETVLAAAMEHIRQRGY